MSCICTHANGWQSLTYVEIPPTDFKYCVMQMNTSESTSQAVAEVEISLSASDVKDKYRVGTLGSLQLWHMYLFSNHYVSGY